MASKQAIIHIDGIPTHIYQLGNARASSRSLVIIPGNPGLGGFYIPFAHQLFNLFEEKMSILIISQAGHSPPHPHCFTLEEQIEHKLKAIEQLLPKEVDHRLILIGHSIGAYMVLKMLDRLEDRLERAFLLFPTLERMSSSPAGQRFVRLYPILLYLLPFLCLLLQFLFPFAWLKRQLISAYFAQSPEEDRAILVDTVLNDLLHPQAVRNLLRMAHEEMAVVRTRDDATIRRFLSRMTFYYGTNDHWVPDDIAQEMRTLYPRGDIRECTQHYMHAFVLKHSKDLAQIVFHRLA